MSCNIDKLFAFYHVSVVVHVFSLIVRIILIVYIDFKYRNIGQDTCLTIRMGR
jgi:hypothetical protein